MRAMLSHRCSVGLAAVPIQCHELPHHLVQGPGKHCIWCVGHLLEWLGLQGSTFGVAHIQLGEHGNQSANWLRSTISFPASDRSCLSAGQHAWLVVCTMPHAGSLAQGLQCLFAGSCVEGR